MKRLTRVLEAGTAACLSLLVLTAFLVSRVRIGDATVHHAGAPLGGLGAAVLLAGGTALAIRRRSAGRTSITDGETLRSILDAGRLRAFSWDIATGRVRRLTGTSDVHTTFEAVVDGVHPDDRDVFLRRIRAALDGGSEYSAEYRQRRADGSVAWVLDRGRVIFDRMGQPVRLAGVAFDITQRKDAEAELERRRREAQALADVARTINAAQDLATILPAIAEAALGLLRCDGARVSLLDRARNTMILRATAGAPTVMAPGFEIGHGMGIGGLAWAQGAVVRSADAATDERVGPDYLSIVLADGIVSCMAAPIRLDGGVEGLIYVNTLSYRPFSYEDERLLTALADHAAVAVRNAEALARERAARAEAEAATRARDALLAMLLPAFARPANRVAERRPPLAAVEPRAVLLVDTCDDARALLREALCAAGHTVYEATDGPSAVEIARTHRFDVALIDLEAPELDGDAVARRLRADAPATLLVALTASGEPEDLERAVAAGFAYHFVKPVDPDALLAILANAAAA